MFFQTHKSLVKLCLSLHKLKHTIESPGNPKIQKIQIGHKRVEQIIVIQVLWRDMIALYNEQIFLSCLYDLLDTLLVTWHFKGGTETS